MASKNESAPPANAGTQRSLNVFSDTLVIERMCDGGHRSVVDAVPEADPDNNVTVREVSSDVGRPKTEFPLERDHCTVSKYSKRRSYRHSSYTARYEYKEFDIQIDREQHENDADHIEDVIARVKKLPALKDEVDAIETYDELVENAELVREYEATYRTVKGIWENSSLKSYAVEYTARHFNIKQFPQGFFTVPGVHNTNVRSILDVKLQGEGIANYSVAWGGFIVEPEAFEEVYDIVKPVYHTPDDEPILDRNRLAE